VVTTKQQPSPVEVKNDCHPISGREMSATGQECVFSSSLEASPEPESTSSTAGEALWLVTNHSQSREKQRSFISALGLDIGEKRMAAGCDRTGLCHWFDDD